jgi:hypothetical protein
MALTTPASNRSDDKGACGLIGTPSVHTIQYAVFAGFFRVRLHLDGIKGKIIPDIFSKYAHTLMINPLSGVTCFIQHNG